MRPTLRRSAGQAERAIEDLEAERDRIDQRINEWYEERDRLRAKADGVDLKRSQMTALEKSKYIRGARRGGLFVPSLELITIAPMVQ